MSHAVNTQDAQTLIDCLKEILKRCHDGQGRKFILLVKFRDVFALDPDELGKTDRITHKIHTGNAPIQDTFDCLDGSLFYSTLDLILGYWQVAMDEQDKEITAFQTSYGLYHFNVTVCLFGVTGAPVTFQRLMQAVLAGLHWEVCIINLDDVIVFGKSIDEHMT